MGREQVNRKQGGEAAWPLPQRSGAAEATDARTRRLSNFFASVMWIQLSFSTTLMCFTSSLNLDK